MLLILTGPAAAGKNTVSAVLAQKREKSAVIDVDTIRHMAIKPHIAPWEEGGQRQVRLGIKNASILARNFQEAGFDVIILDIVTDELAKIYRENLKDFDPKIVLLLPSLEEAKKRNSLRSYNLEEEILVNLHRDQSNFKDYDEKIDNTNISPDVTADKINQLF